MKTKFKSAISYLLAAILTVSVVAVTIVAFTGCSDDVDKNTKTMVYSNGGSVVEYGDYVYFINGIAGYPDMTTTDDVNEAGKVLKGGLYRAKKHAAVINNWDKDLSQDIKDDYNEHQTIDFVSNKLDWFDLRNYTISDFHDTDEDGNEIPHYEHSSDHVEYHVANVNKNNPNREEGDEPVMAVEPVANKIIGTGNYTGGIFIFDDRIYFASPANSLDKDGKYQYNKVDFFTCNLDGSNLSKLYTTTGAVDTTTTTDEETGETSSTGKINSIPYGFTKQNNKVYLTTFEQWYATDEDETAGRLTGYLITTEIANGLVRRQTIVAKDILGAYFPVKETYDPDASTNTIYDFVYTIRKAENDPNNYGTVIEMMRPDGSDRDVVINNNKAATIEGISGDFLYYRNTFAGKSTLEYTNLYPQLENSSYEKQIVKGVQEFKKDSSGNKILKNGNTFISEQKALVEGYEAWDKAGRPANDAREQNYVMSCDAGREYRPGGYIQPMGETVSHVLIDDISGNSISSIFLLPQRSYGDNIVRVIYSNGSNLYNSSAHETFIITGASFTPLQYDGIKLYGYSGESSGFSYIYAHKASSGLSSLPGNYTSISTGTPLQMDLLRVHDSKGNVVNTHVAYFTNYPASEQATNYMVMLKVNGLGNAEGYGPVPIGYVLPSEKTAIVCYDPDCIDYTHNHSTRDGYEPGVDPEAEEEQTGEEGMSFS